jgi:hypothetical protein
MKSTLKGQNSYDATDMTRNATEELKRLSQNGFQECFQDVRSRWLKCIFEKWGLSCRKYSLNSGTLLYL